MKDYREELVCIISIYAGCTENGSVHVYGIDETIKKTINNTLQLTNDSYNTIAILLCTGARGHSPFSFTCVAFQVILGRGQMIHDHTVHLLGMSCMRPR